MTSLENLVARIPFERGESLLSMFDHGEGVLGLEMIIENLYEFDVVVSPEERQHLRDLAVQRALDAKFVDLIEEIPTHNDLQRTRS